jgi:hypothetical protein
MCLSGIVIFICNIFQDYALCREMVVWLSKMVLAQHFCILWNAEQSLTATREECNKYDVTAAPYYWLANHNDWSRWFAISSLQPLCTFSFMGEFGRKKSLNLSVRNIFPMSHTELCWRCLLAKSSFNHTCSTIKLQWSMSSCISICA